NTAEPPGASSIASFELRNNSAKTITAYVFNHTFTHGGKTDYYAGTGTDLVSEMAIAKSSPEQTLSNSTFTPAGVVKQEIRGGGRDGQFEVFPCLVVFDDGTFVGPSSLWKILRKARANHAKAIGALVADLKLAQDSADPKTLLTNRAKQVKKISKGRSDEEPYRYLEIVASALSQTGNTPLDRKTLTDHLSALQAQQEMF